MDLSEADIIKRVLNEEKTTADAALQGLVRTLVNHHLRVGPSRLHIPDESPLEAVQRALADEIMHNNAIAQKHANEEEPDDGAWMSGVIAGNNSLIQQTLLVILSQAQELGEKQDEMEREERAMMREDDGKPHMRIVE